MLRRGWMLVLAFGMFGLVGCSSNQREGLVSQAVNILDTTATSLDNVKARALDAIKKKDKGIDLKETEAACKQLGDNGKQLQQLYHAAQALKEGTTPDEVKEYSKRFAARIQDGMKRIGEAGRDASEAIRKLETEVKDDPQAKAEVEKIRDLFNKAQGEFEALAVRAR